jgi:hypothetical protein
MKKYDVYFKRCTNLCERNRKVVYKYEGFWTCKGCVGKL